MIERRALAPALVAAALGCAAPRADLGPALAPGARLADLPPGYSLVLGRLRFTRHGQAVACPPAPGAQACGLVLRYKTGQSFLVPHAPVPSTVPEFGAPDPFFTIRLPAGAYRVTQVEGPSGTIPVKRKFSVREGEVLYVGSLEVDLTEPPGRVRVLDERDDASRVAGEVDSAALARFAARPME